MINHTESETNEEQSIHYCRRRGEFVGKMVKHVIIQYEDDSLDFVEQGVLFHVKKDRENATLFTFGEMGRDVIWGYLCQLGLPLEKVEEVERKMLALGIANILNFTHLIENRERDVENQ